jgi:hypothetical protein
MMTFRESNRSTFGNNDQSGEGWNTYIDLLLPTRTFIKLASNLRRTITSYTTQTNRTTSVKSIGTYQKNKIQAARYRLTGFMQAYMV